MKLPKIALAILAGSALAQSQVAYAQQACISEAEVAALAVYVVPSAIRGAQTSCATRLASDGWLAQNGASLASRYAALGAETWPRAKRALMVFIGQSASKTGQAADEGIDQLIANMPDESLRPFVDAIILQKVAEEVKPQSCKSIERVLEVISRFEPRDTGALIGVVLSLVDLKEPKICPAVQA